MRVYRFRPASSDPAASHSGALPARAGSRALVALASAAVAGSGLLNLFSLMGGPAPTSQPGWVRGLFPLSLYGANRTAYGANRTAVLLLGFALILTSVHLFSLKRRALYLAATLSACAALLHFAGARDLAAGVSSALAAVALILLRGLFRVGSATPSLWLALKRAAISIAAAAVYGTAGFWLLEPHEFGRNFHWWQALANTFRVMLLVGDPGLSPRTPYANWFLDSLELLTGAALFYCGFVLFRPVAYRFFVNEQDRERARRIAERYGRSGLDFFKHWPDKSLFFSSSRRSFLAYRVAGHFALILGDPVGPEDDLEQTVRQFATFCRERGWRFGFHQASAGRLALYRRLGFRALRIGDDALVDLGQFSLQGSAMKEFRNTVARLDRLGYRVARFDPPLPPALLEELKAVSDEWLSIPGNRERRFTLGRFDTAYVRSTIVYAVFDGEGRVAAFLNLIPSYREGLATVDLMRRRAGAANGVMDYLFAKAFLDLKQRGYSYFSLGMAPLAEPGAQDEPTPEERLLQWTLRRFPSLFRAASLRRFKAKYAHQWEPLYDIYLSRWDLPRFALALRSVSELSGELRSAA